jgi:hypothetical protein
MAAATAHTCKQASKRGRKTKEKTEQYLLMASVINTVGHTQHWWFMPAILVTWEAEIRKMEAQGLPGQIAHETPK